MLTLATALALHEAGLRWSPAPGDRFVLPGKGMDDDVFVISDMTIEVHRFPSGPVIGFNGTTEWALDSIRYDEALWLPAEHQLRELLGDRFASLEAGPDGFTVTVLVDEGVVACQAQDAAEAYALALLDVLTRGGLASSA